MTESDFILHIPGFFTDPEGNQWGNTVAFAKAAAVPHWKVRRNAEDVIAWAAERGEDSGFREYIHKTERGRSIKAYEFEAIEATHLFPGLNAPEADALLTQFSELMVKIRRASGITPEKFFEQLGLTPYYKQEDGKFIDLDGRPPS